MEEERGMYHWQKTENKKGIQAEVKKVSFGTRNRLALSEDR